ncbi:hypothetical protein Pmani_027233, partial [Petrolisthes manimaculis]
TTSKGTTAPGADRHHPPPQGSCRGGDG